MTLCHNSQPACHTCCAVRLTKILIAAVQGLALGVTYVKAGFSTLKYLVLGFAFVIVTPIGIAIGIAVGSSYNR